MKHETENTGTSVFLIKIESMIKKALQHGNAQDQVFRKKIYKQALKACDEITRKNPEIKFMEKEKPLLLEKIKEIETEFNLQHSSFDEKSISVSLVKNHKSKKIKAYKEDDILDLRPGVSESLTENIAHEEKNTGHLSEKNYVENSESHYALDSLSLKKEQGKNKQKNNCGKTLLDFAVTQDFQKQRKNKIIPSSQRKKNLFKRISIFTIFVFFIVCLTYFGYYFIQTSFDKKETFLSAFYPQTLLEKKKESDANSLNLKSQNKEKKQDNILKIFSPLRSSYVYAPSGTQVKRLTHDTETFLRIHSTVKGASISFDVAASLLEKLSGKNIVLSITAQAEIGKVTQMSVTCNFGNLGSCNRKRYTVNDERSEYLLRFSIPEGKSSDKDGILAINPDFNHLGMFIDIYGIEAWVEE